MALRVGDVVHNPGKDNASPGVPWEGRVVAIRRERPYDRLHWVQWPDMTGPISYFPTELALLRRPVQLGDKLRKRDGSEFSFRATDTTLELASRFQGHYDGYEHFDGTPIDKPAMTLKQAAAAAANAWRDGIEPVYQKLDRDHPAHKVKIEISGVGVDRKAAAAACARVLAAAFKPEEPTFKFTCAELARKLFAADPRTKALMVGLEKPQFEKAYARGIFGYSPEVDFARTAWELALAAC